MLSVKKILVVATDMEIGGAERALLGLLSAIDKEEYQVDLFLLRHEGPFMSLIPRGINILPEKAKYSDLGIPIERVIKRGHVDMLIGRTIGKYKAKKFIKQNKLKPENSVEIHYSFRYTINFLPVISEKEYDLAIGFTIPYYILDKKVYARNKCVWIHTDYSMRDGDREEELRVWSAYPYIASISEDVTNAFLKVYPSLRDRIYPIDNIVTGEMIWKQADLFDVENEMPTESNVIRLLSVGRFVPQKNFDNIPDICSRIIKKGRNIKWYIIGYGNDQELIYEKIRENHMEDHVIILGKKENPYPYIKKCDIYVQPSRYEGKAVSVREAQILHKPVVITNFSTSSSQVREEIDGIIVPMDNEGCAEGISKLINDIEKRQKLIDNCISTNYSNSDEIKKIYQLL